MMNVAYVKGTSRYTFQGSILLCSLFKNPHSHVAVVNHTDLTKDGVVVTSNWHYLRSNVHKKLIKIVRGGTNADNRYHPNTTSNFGKRKKIVCLAIPNNRKIT